MKIEYNKSEFEERAINNSTFFFGKMINNKYYGLIYILM